MPHWRRIPKLSKKLGKSFQRAKEKANVVEKDFTEKNIRAYLNLGHTFAHAYESIMGLGAITHGEAVAWGIGRAITYSKII